MFAIASAVAAPAPFAFDLSAALAPLFVVVQLALLFGAAGAIVYDALAYGRTVIATATPVPQLRQGPPAVSWQSTEPPLAA